MQPDLLPTLEPEKTISCLILNAALIVCFKKYLEEVKPAIIIEKKKKEIKAAVEMY